MNVFEARNVNKQYTDKYALNNVSISVPKGKVCGLLGPNGAGKTTLLRIINHITSIDSGELFFKGRKMDNSDLINISYLPEERGLYKKMKVGEQLLYLARLKGLSKNDAQSRLNSKFKQFDIIHWWNKTVDELSKGMQQKVQFVNAIVQEPEFLIFDEPFSGFDPINANVFKEELLSLKNSGTTILLSTHDMSSVEEMCDNIFLINNAKIILEGEIESVREKYKTNTYNIILDEVLQKDSYLFNKQEVLESELIKGKTHLKIRSKENIGADVLIKEIMKDYKLISFTEEMPGMKEVFINAINN